MPFSTVRSYWFEAVQTFPGESAPAGAQLESSMDGGETLADTSLACQVLVEALTPGKSMLAQFAALAPYDEHIRVFNDATEVYNGSSPGQPLVTFEHWPQRIRQEIVSGLPQQELQFDSPSTITVNGLPVGSGNRIVIDPEGLALMTITTFSRHRVRVKLIDSVYTYPKLPPTLVSIAGSGSFGGTSSFATGLGPRSVDIGDLNADANPDVVVANSSDNTVSVLFGNGSGGFGPKMDLPTGADPRSVAIGDVNGDGHADLVVADHADSKISVLLGGGPGGFGSALDYPTASSPSAVAIVDLNGDGRPDVIVACGGLGGSVSVLLATGFGALGAKTDYPVGDFPTALAVGEVNGDGKPDVVVANSGSNTVSLLPGDGIGGFGPGTDFPALAPFSVALADMNLDGYPDLVVANHSGGTISVLLGFGPGSFGPSTSFAVGGSPVHLSVADLNGDENPDIGVANPSAGTASVLFGNGLGGVLSTIAPITGGLPNSVTFCDINNDGTLDMVEADGAGFASVVLGQGGSISPAGAREFAAGDSPLYVIDPTPGYAIANVLVDGVAKGPIGSYQFNGVTKRHTITARFSSLSGVGSPTTTQTLTLSGVQPNPSRGSRLEVHFALSSASRARLELLDISGRLMLERQVGSLGPGRHTVSLSPSQPLEPGIYWIRLSQNSLLRAVKVVVIE